MTFVTDADNSFKSYSLIFATSIFLSILAIVIVLTLGVESRRFASLPFKSISIASKKKKALIKADSGFPFQSRKQNE